MTREAIISAVPCPQCGAAIGESCRGQKALHVKRIGKAEMLHGWQSGPDVQSAEMARLKREWHSAGDKARHRR